MTIESSGALGLNGTCTGGSSARNQIGAEVGKTAGTALCMNNSCLRTLSGTTSGSQVSFSSFYGKANQFTYTISSNKTNLCMRAGAVTAGWNGTSKLVVNINSGVIISSNATGTPAMTISGSFPAGVTVNNSGTIVGMGGSGGCGGYPSGGSGGTGATALYVRSAVTVNNTSGTIAGGGGGGGGGGGNYCGCFGGYGGGGGGGGRSGSTNAPGGGGGPINGTGYGGTGGGCGTFASAGSAGGRGFNGVATAGAAGGNWGASGGSGQGGCQGGGGGGGSGGKATCGAGTYITWSGTGTRYGSIS